jgi:8-oxo-dGTP pyrophosphatase MutT (NUDIX family)
MNNLTLFQYCPKLVLFSADRQSVLLARRVGEADYDGTFSLVGGKAETTDESLLAAIKREKDEEIGPNAKVRVCWRMSAYQVLFRKKDGNAMVLPHHAAVFADGEIVINPEEYTEYRWVPITELATFKPMVENIPDVVQAAQRLLAILSDDDFDVI